MFSGCKPNYGIQNLGCSQMEANFGVPRLFCGRIFQVNLLEIWAIFGQLFEGAHAILISDYDEILVKIMQLILPFRQSQVALAYNVFRVSAVS